MVSGVRRRRKDFISTISCEHCLPLCGAILSTTQCVVDLMAAERYALLAGGYEGPEQWLESHQSRP